MKRNVLGMVIGGAVGLAIGIVSKCAWPGRCFLANDPVTTTAVFALLGFMIAKYSGKQGK